MTTTAATDVDTCSDHSSAANNNIAACHTTVRMHSLCVTLLRITIVAVSAHQQNRCYNSANLHDTADTALITQDLVVARVRDVDDSVAWALQRGDIRGALTVALRNRHSLRTHSFKDLVSRYFIITVTLVNVPAVSASPYTDCAVIC
jgi:hypothetical protein